MSSSKIDVPTNSIFFARDKVTDVLNANKSNTSTSNNSIKPTTPAVEERRSSRLASIIRSNQAHDDEEDDLDSDDSDDVVLVEEKRTIEDEDDDDDMYDKDDDRGADDDSYDHSDVVDTLFRNAMKNSKNPKASKKRGWSNTWNNSGAIDIVAALSSNNSSDISGLLDIVSPTGKKSRGRPRKIITPVEVRYIE